MFEVAMLFISLLIGFFNLLFKAIFYILRNAFLANFVLISILGFVYLINTYSMDWLYSVLISVGAAIIIVFMMAKLKYIRLILLGGFGIVWGYCFYVIMAKIIQIPNHPRFSFGCSALIGFLYFAGHVKQGLEQGEVLGRVYDPLGYLFCKLKDKLITKKYLRAVGKGEMRANEAYIQIKKALGQEINQEELSEIRDVGI